MASTTSEDEILREQADGALDDMRRRENTGTEERLEQRGSRTARERPTDAGGHGEIERAGKRGHVDNPFVGWPVEAVDEVTEVFVRSTGLGEHAAVFKKAGKVWRNPQLWREYPDIGLSPDEKAALEHEFLRFRHQPKALKASTLMFCVGALVQGWSQIIATGANIEWPPALGLYSFKPCPDNPDEVNPTPFDVWMFALVNASAYFAASLIGCYLSDPLSDLFLGRRAPVFTSAIFIFAASIGSACCQRYEQLLACRVLLGIGMGGKATVLPVYAAEIAPSHLRGTVVVNWQIFVALGICLGFGSKWIVSTVIGEDGGAWRWQNAALCLPTLILLILVYGSTESPRFQLRSKPNLWGGSLRPLWSGPVGLRRWLSNVAFGCLVFMRGFVCLDPTSTRAGSDSRGVSTTSNDSRRVRGCSSAKDESVDRPERGRDGPVVSPQFANYEEAFETLIQLRGAPILAAKELLWMHVQMVVEKESILGARREANPKGRANVVTAELKPPELDVILRSTWEVKLSYFEKLTHLWTIPRLWRATRTALVAMLSQQFCGVNVLIFYSTTLYASDDLCEPNRNDAKEALQLSFGIGLVNFIFAIPAYWLIHRPGRSSMMLLTLPFTTVFMLGACLGYHKPDGPVPVFTAFTFLFMVAYSLGLGQVPFTLSSEVFPLEYRMVGMSLSVSANLLGAGVLALIVPSIYSSDLGNKGLLGIITALNLLAFGFILLFVRETAGATRSGIGGEGIRQPLSLEELAEIFTLSTKEYLRRQREDLLPWPIDVILRRRRSTEGDDEETRVDATELRDLSSSAERSHRTRSRNDAGDDAGE